MSRALHVGTYADAGLYRLDETRGGWSLGDAFPGVPNASFGVYSPRFDLHYLVDERADGALRVLRRDAAGWRLLAHVSTHGAAPCYIALDRSENWLAVANYEAGSTALYRLDLDSGLPGDPVAVHANAGQGPVAERQDGPHAHCVVFSPDGKWLYQTDLGTDEVLGRSFDPDLGPSGMPTVAFAAPAGSGPRHLVFHPTAPLAYLVSELASTVTVFDVGDGVLSPRGMMSTLPPGFDGESLGGHIAVDAAGELLYVTNRGHDSIAVFALDESGCPALLQHVPSGGASPRFFLLRTSERQMLVANEKGNNLTVFAVAADGTLTQTAEVAVVKPAFILSDVGGS